jgi:hypothetical protein
MHGQYASFMLRIWVDSGSGEVRATLRDVLSGDCHDFRCLEDLSEYLKTCLNNQSGKPQQPEILH